MRCGSVAGYCRNRRLETRCRGNCPEGSRGPIMRLANGRHPHPQRGMGRIWPNGEMSPVPTRWEVDRRVWEDLLDSTGMSNWETSVDENGDSDENTNQYQRGTLGTNTSVRMGNRGGHKDCFSDLGDVARSNRHGGNDAVEDTQMSWDANDGTSRPAKRQRF